MIELSYLLLICLFHLLNHHLIGLFRYLIFYMIPWLLKTSAMITLLPLTACTITPISHLAFKVLDLYQMLLSIFKALYAIPARSISLRVGGTLGLELLCLLE